MAGCALVLSTGCERAPEEPAPRASSPADVCTSLVSYWVKEALKGSTWAGLDWEQKGLSNEQYEIHDEVLLAARTEERRAGREAAFALADRESRRLCEQAKGATGSSENWRPPSEQRVPTGGLRPSPS
ncbi:hypothetical protein VO63_08890 [Streptomyces showdoensis]|uniref:Uncharacterized protein n=1 Tax=Streptomyces showdoensis TaxID=68268 RepID=A0A2P2GS34_STREW|nr:hypothetical protein VO63_08890 [Streptomyces showdoensis]